MTTPRRILEELSKPISFVLGSSVTADYVQRHFEFVLTRAETEIMLNLSELDPLAIGRVRVTYKELAARLHKSVRTIEHQVQRLIHKGVLIRRGRWLVIAGAGQHKLHQCGNARCIAASRSFKRAAKEAPTANLLARQEEQAKAPAKVRALEKALAAAKDVIASLRAEIKKLRPAGLGLPYTGEFAVAVDLTAGTGFNLPAFEPAPRSRSSGRHRPEPDPRF